MAKNGEMRGGSNIAQQWRNKAAKAAAWRWRIGNGVAENNGQQLIVAAIESDGNHLANST